MSTRLAATTRSMRGRSGSSSRPGRPRRARCPRSPALAACRDDLLQHGQRARRAEATTSRPGLELAEEEDVVDQLADLLHLARAPARPSRRRRRRAAQSVEQDDQPRERRAQLVRHGRGEARRAAPRRRRGRRAYRGRRASRCRRRPRTRRRGERGSLGLEHLARGGRSPRRRPPAPRARAGREHDAASASRTTHDLAALLDERPAPLARGERRVWPRRRGSNGRAREPLHAALVTTPVTTCSRLYPARRPSRRRSWQKSLHGQAFSSSRTTPSSPTAWPDISRGRVRADRVDQGETGLARLRYEQPDVCVLDLMLPGLDGWRSSRRSAARGSARRSSSSAPAAPSTTAFTRSSSEPTTTSSSRSR